MIARAQSANEGGEQGNVGGERLCTSVRTELFCDIIYWAKARPDPKFQSSSWYCRGLGRQTLRIMQDYNVTNKIEIQTLTQPRTCEMVSLSFSAMSWLKLESTTRTSFPSIPSTERINRENPVACGSAYHACTSFPSTNEPWAYPLTHTCRYPRQNLQTWRWWRRQPGFPIRLGWESHI